MASVSRQTAGVDFHRDSSHFFGVCQELFLGFRDYIDRPTHDRLVALRQTGRIPREGIEGRRDDLARLPFHFLLLVTPLHKRLTAR